ncbi:MAG: lipocalin-like domain-containing protein [Hyphomicrobiales bacterium]|nr:lipocalin-like domain-containing protein [Alphaproteobacteria bacterium]
MPLSNEQQQIIGVWKLVSVMYEDQATKEMTPIMGAQPRGFQIATPDGRWLALATPSGRTAPATDEERAQAFRTMIGYSGRYRVEGATITTKVDVAWNESWVGGEQVRHIRFEADKLFIESPPMPHPNMYGKTVRVIVVWQRDGQLR